MITRPAAPRPAFDCCTDLLAAGRPASEPPAGGPRARFSESSNDANGGKRRRSRGEPRPDLESPPPSP